MVERVEAVSRWFYRGLWGILTRWFRVPDQPPSLPIRPGESARSFQPAQGFLRLLKFKFWIALVLFDGLVFLLWLIVLLVWPLWGILLALPALLIAVVPDIIAYLAIHLRYDTTWYVMTDRSLRIRRGIWIIHETTITFENVQNVKITQGPLQRWFGIADLLVETAGGGVPAPSAHQHQTTSSHRGLIEGIAAAHQIRDLLLARIRRSRSAGLGDEAAELPARRGPAWSAEHLAILSEIRDAALALKRQS